MTDALDLDSLAALEKAATPGPWDYETELLSPDVDINGFHWRPYGHTYSPEWGGDSPQAAADGALIAAARNALPRLLALARAGERLAAAVEATQWMANPNEDDGRPGPCPECGWRPGHADHCELAAALANWQVARGPETPARPQSIP